MDCTKVRSLYYANEKTKCREEEVRPFKILHNVRHLHTSAIRRDLDTAAKFIGAGAATMGVSGSGIMFFSFCHYPLLIINQS